MQKLASLAQSDFLKKAEALAQPELKLREPEAAVLKTLKERVRYPEIPSLFVCRLTKTEPLADPSLSLPVSAGLTDPVLMAARQLSLFKDLKWIVDLQKKTHSERDYFNEIQIAEAKTRTHFSSSEVSHEALSFFLKEVLENAYETGAKLTEPTSLLQTKTPTTESADSRVQEALQQIEKLWPNLIRMPEPKPGSSLLPVPYPVLIPAGRFQESYYWDTYYGILGLLLSGRLELAQMQIENLLNSVQSFGFVPNGGRDYYLSRSQPPFLSTSVRLVFEASWKAQPERRRELLRWLKERGFPLTAFDYQNFWMNPETRFDEAHGLNHHWDAFDSPRPERHGSDCEERLGQSYRAVRAAAESGLDFTLTHEGQSSRLASVLLNSLLFETEMNLSWMAEKLELIEKSKDFLERAQRRKRAVDLYLWNPESGTYRPYHLDENRRLEQDSAESLFPLLVGLASQEQAARLREFLSRLESPNGLRASCLIESPHQWDGDNAWAPFHITAIEGLNRYQYFEDAERLKSKWLRLVLDTFERTGKFYERYDLKACSEAKDDGQKYPVQEGFLWTNASVLWALRRSLSVSSEKQDLA
ncbi:MAG: hypothetical protein EA369_08065 [Bradymonadales bacterium]|nr:MAG: hypothetical protein EA369_08065 [Bradymonadales bacterium]